MLYISTKNKVKEHFKDVYYKNKLNNMPNKFIFLHIPKSGGTSIRKTLKRDFNAYIYDWHEIKLKHLKHTQSAIVSLRDPITRFESAFYSKLHMKKELTEEEKAFYKKYDNINKFVYELENNYKELTKSLKYLKSFPVITRYSSLKYWFGGKKKLEKSSQKIRYIIRVEEMDKDLSELYEMEGVEYEKPPKRLNEAPKDRFEPIDRKYIKFLSSYLNEEYIIANTILKEHCKTVYRIPKF